MPAALGSLAVCLVVLAVLPVHSSGKFRHPQGPQRVQLRAGEILRSSIGPNERQEHLIFLVHRAFVRVQLESAQGVLDATLHLAGNDPRPLSPAEPRYQSVFWVGGGPASARLEILGNRRSRARYTLSVSRPVDMSPRLGIEIEAEEALREALILQQGLDAESLQGALVKLHRSADTFKRSNRNWRAAEAWVRAGAVRMRLGEPREALKANLKALGLSSPEGTPHLHADALSGSCLSMVLLGRPEAESRCNEAVTFAQESSDELRTADALNHLGEFFYNLGRLGEARAPKQSALKTYRLWEDRPSQAQVLFDLGYLDSDAGNMDEAQRHFQQAQSLWRELDDPRGRAQCLRGLAQMHDRQGMWQEALDLYYKAFPLIQKAGDKIWLASILNGDATIHFKLGDVERALKGFREAYDIFKAVGLLTGQASNLMQLGMAHFALGELKASRDVLQEALDLFREIGDQRMESNTLRNMGRVLGAQGRPAKARSFLQQALELKHPEEDPSWAAYTLVDLGSLDLDGRKPREALGHLKEAQRLSLQAQDKTGQSLASAYLSEAFEQLGRLDEALEEIERAVHLAEGLRGNVASLELRTIYGTRLHQFHARHVRLLMEAERNRPGQGYAAQAFHASESKRARTLIDALAGDLPQRVDNLPAEASDELRRLREQVNEMNRRLSRLLTQPGPEAQKESVAIARRMADLSIRADKLQSRKRQGAQRFPSLMGVEAIQQHLDADTMLLEFALAEPTSYLWTISRSGFNAYPLPARYLIEAEARQLYGWLRMPSTAGQSQWERSAERLARMLLASVRHKLPPRLIVVSDGALRLIPLGIIPSPSPGEKGKILLESHEIVRLPSASLIGWLRERKPTANSGLAVFADPVFSPLDSRLQGAPDVLDLESRVRGLRSFAGDTILRLFFTRREAQAITRYFDPPPFVAMDHQASRDQALSPEMRRYDILHFATHALADDQHPQLSGLIFSLFTATGEPANGFVRQDEIAQLQLQARLVVLSACGTALGKSVEGEGLMNLVRSFFQAGAASVAATLWPVDDRATSELMTRFYYSLLVEGKSAPAALRQAQLGIRSQKAWGHPSFWAGFMLHGDWDVKMLSG